MATDAITPTAVRAAMARDDQAEHDAVAGQVVCNLAFTRGMVADASPREWEEVAAFLFALINRAPVRDSPDMAAHRMILGSLASELRGYAHQAGEAVGVQADLRAATSKAEERRVRARVGDEAVAFDRHIDDVIAADRVQKTTAHATQEDDIAQDAPLPTETDDDPLAWL